MLGLTTTIGTLADFAPQLLFGVLFMLAVGAAISLVFVFLSLAGLYLLLAAPFIAAVQVIVYAGAIMVLVVFVIMLLNVEEEEHRPARLGYLVPVSIVFAAVLLAEAAFIIFFVHDTGSERALAASPANTGLTANIGTGLFTTYLLPFEITSLLILMAIVGAMSLARRTTVIRPTDLLVPGAQVLPRHVLTAAPDSDATPVVSNTTTEAESALGLTGSPHRRERD